MNNRKRFRRHELFSTIFIFAYLSMVAARVLLVFFLGFFAFSRHAFVLAADFLDPPILPISDAVSCFLLVVIGY